MKPLYRTILPIILLISHQGFAQQQQYMTYYDDGKTIIKEIYTLKSGNTKVLHGPYTSYYENGVAKTLGQYFNNVSTGIWEFNYSTGKIRMRGELNKGQNDGYWEYFYENGEKSMEGDIQAKLRQGFWKMYFDNGSLKSEGNFSNGKIDGTWKYYFEKGGLKATAKYERGKGNYKEYYPSGNLKMEGLKSNGKKEGYWSYYYEDGTIKGEGEYSDDQREGNWKFYNGQGSISSEGYYSMGQPDGSWVDYHPDGSISSQGQFSSGQKNGFWKLFYEDGRQKAEGNFENGSGDYIEYYKNGQIKIEGKLQNGKNYGAWNYYYENGKIEGIADFKDGVGDYIGYYTKGQIKMKGTLRNNERVGIWELYKQDGVLAGYYKPYYEDGKSTLWIAKDTKQQKELNKARAKKVGSYQYKKRKFNYFDPQINEFRALIIGYNPLAPVVNSFLVSLEYYNQERLGHELLFNLIRDPFFRNHNSLDLEEEYEEGFEVAIRQKFYTKEKKLGVPYFGHEIRYSNINHLVRIEDENLSPDIVELNQDETKYEYSIFVGSRFFKNQNEGGMTLDTYIGLGIGYRDYSSNYEPTTTSAEYFSDLPTSKVSFAFRFGVNLGIAIRTRR